jgi:hypothetical protein
MPNQKNIGKQITIWKGDFINGLWIIILVWLSLVMFYESQTWSFMAIKKL